jgi:hypothetical protein
MNNVHNINLIMSKAREEWINFWFCWCFPTNKAHALDLYLVLMSRTHFKQSVRGDDPPNSTSGSSELVTMRRIRLSPKISFKTLNKEEEVGGTTIRSATNGGTTTRIFILKSKLIYSISKPPQERAQFGGLQNPNTCHEVKSIVIHIYAFFSLKTWSGFLSSLKPGGCST